MTGPNPAAVDPSVVRLAGRRSRACVEKWEAIDGEYHPACCRFPKPCSPYPYPEAIAAGNVTEADLEPAAPLPPLCPPCGFRHTGGQAAHLYVDPTELQTGTHGPDVWRVELANIRRLCQRHGVPEADGNGELRSTVAMVEEALIARPPVT